MKRTATLIIGAIVLATPLFASAATFTHSLAVGSRGDEVTSLQNILVSLKFLNVTPTGYFGALTKQAVMAYQKASGLEQVGSVGPKTRALLNLTGGSTTTNLTPIPSVTVSTQPTTPAPTPTPVTPPVTPPATQPATTTVAASTTTSATLTPSPNDPPKITLISPQSVVPQNMYDLTFAVSTDKPAYCKYGTQTGMSLTSMTSLEDNGTMHSKYLTGLQSGGLYIYYVKCEDMQAHVTGDFNVTFSLTGH